MCGGFVGGSSLHWTDFSWWVCWWEHVWWVSRSGFLVGANDGLAMVGPLAGASMELQQW